MSKSNGEHFGIVQPGEGVLVEQVVLAPIRDGMKAGTHFLDEESQQAVREALDAPETSKAEAKAILNMPPNKSFRNAYTSLVMDDVWPLYSTLATAEDPGVYTLQSDGSNAELVRQSTESVARLSLQALADHIAASNQAMATFSVCELFSDGKIPKICGDAEKDAEYFNAFREHAELLFTHTNRYFETAPLPVDYPARFVMSGMQSLKTHVYGIPNLLDGVATNEGIVLTPDQHRRGVGATYNKGIRPYFYPTEPVLMAVDLQFADKETQRLLPECWQSSGDPDNFLVFPKPELVQEGNSIAAQKGTLPVQTGCPVVHSRVVSLEAFPGSTAPFIRELGRVVLSQLDALYYPHR